MPEGGFALLLKQQFASVGTLQDRQVALLEEHYTHYERWNRVLNLSSVRDVEGAVMRHYCESLFLAWNLPAGPQRLVDVGSGAGFPGVPIGVLREDCEVTLVEAHRRKAVFLKEVTRGLGNVSVFAGRAEAVSTRFDWMVSRAVSWDDLQKHAAGLAAAIALLAGAQDATRIRRTPGMAWEDPIRLPWGRERVLLFGHRST